MTMPVAGNATVVNLAMRFPALTAAVAAGGIAFSTIPPLPELVPVEVPKIEIVVPVKEAPPVEILCGTKKSGPCKLKG